MIKTFRRCPKQAEYKYVQLLKPRQLGKPLRQGTWLHKLQEIFHSGGDWRAEHERLTIKFSKLFDEEKEKLGDLPRECLRMMHSYIWHYKLDEWKVLEAELVLETEFPNGVVYRGRIDLLVENAWGLWIVDHKWNKTLPDLSFRILDAQSALYIWAARRMGIPVQGHIWNYGKRKAPSIPKLLLDGTRLSRAACDTDYPTMLAAIKKYKLDPEDYRDKLLSLKRQRYVPGEPQTSVFFRRDVLEKSDEMLKQVAREGYHTAIRMNEYDFTKTGFVERVPDRSCTFMCNYTDLCTLELFGGEPRQIRKSRYMVGDPMDYYYDDPKGSEKDA